MWPFKKSQVQILEFERGGYVVTFDGYYLDKNLRSTWRARGNMASECMVFSEEEARNIANLHQQSPLCKIKRVIKLYDELAHPLQGGDIMTGEREG